MYFTRPITGNIFRSMDSLVLRQPIICTENNVRSFISVPICVQRDSSGILGLKRQCQKIFELNFFHKSSFPNSPYYCIPRCPWRQQQIDHRCCWILTPVVTSLHLHTLIAVTPAVNCRYCQRPMRKIATCVTVSDTRGHQYYCRLPTT
jgi:hypothetical protein